MHTIRVIYSPTTRRISLEKGNDNYGGASTDVNSVKVSVTGIKAADFGENFVARVDFGVQVKTADHIYNHPFVVLERNSDHTPPGQSHPYEAIVPNAVLNAAGETRGKLPIQLVLSDDNMVINSRNTIMLEVTNAIAGEEDLASLPPYDVPEWTIPEGQVPEEEDIHLVGVVYDPVTRKIEVSDDNSLYGGSTIDCRSVKLMVTGIEPVGDDFSVRADFAMPVKVGTGEFVRPFIVLQQVGSAWCGMIPQPVLMAAREQKKLPFQLVMRHGDTVINTRNAVTLEITRAINAMELIHEEYAPYIMYRNDTWEWLEDFTYSEGAVVVRGDRLFISLSDDNLGHDPLETEGEYWAPADNAGVIYLNGEKTVLNESVSIYVPDTAGTAGQMLFSSGDGAPYWADLGLEFTPLQLEERSGVEASWTPIESGHENPAAIFRYSRVTGPAPDFTVTFGVDGMDDIQNMRIYIDSNGEMSDRPMDHYDPSMEGADTQASLTVVPVYADADRVITIAEGWFVLEKANGVLQWTVIGLNGTLTCSNGTISVTGSHMPTPYTFQAPEWFYYADATGDYGRYTVMEVSDGLYMDNEPICPIGIDAEQDIIYDSVPLNFRGIPLTDVEWYLVKDGDRISEMYWTFTKEGDAHRINAQVFILPKTIGGN